MNEMIDMIKSFMMLTSFDEPFYRSVLNRLISFGYTLNTEDAWMISFSIQKVEHHIKNSCNISSVPNGLFNVAVDMICGEFLLALKQTGQLNIQNINLDVAINQIREGDMTVEFNNGLSEDEKLTSLINYLRTNGEDDFVCYRKIKW